MYRNFGTNFLSQCKHMGIHIQGHPMYVKKGSQIILSISLFVNFTRGSRKSIA